jgi:hypothetical protein
MAQAVSLSGQKIYFTQSFENELHCVHMLLCNQECTNDWCYKCMSGDYIVLVPVMHYSKNSTNMQCRMLLSSIVAVKLVVSLRANIAVDKWSIGI